MAQLHCYLPDNLARKFRDKARAARLPVSKYLALLVKKDLENKWPEGYFDVFGGWQGEPLERPEQSDFEERLGLD
jgi:hypothetical protein